MVDFSFNVLWTPKHDNNWYYVTHKLNWIEGYIKANKRKHCITSARQRVFTECLYLGYTKNYVQGSVPGAEHRIQMRKHRQAPKWHIRQEICEKELWGAYKCRYRKKIKLNSCQQWLTCPGGVKH